jgi:histidinol phosphatase-like PHP family hydrolase
MEAQIEAAVYRGLDALVFTNHERLVPLERIEELNRTYAPFRVFGGIEVTVREWEDILVLGIHDPALETDSWSYPDLHAFVRENDGWIAVAHPFRFRSTINLDLERFPPDALEVCSSNISLSAHPRIRDVAENLGIPVVCNSDAHIMRDIGAGYNRLKGEPEDDKGVIDLLRRGAFLCVCGMT